jgi:hypothetical protein
MCERIAFIPCFHSHIIHQLEPAARAVLWLYRDNRRKAQNLLLNYLSPSQIRYDVSLWQSYLKPGSIVMNIVS